LYDGHLSLSLSQLQGYAQLQGGKKREMEELGRNIFEKILDRPFPTLFFFSHLHSSAGLLLLFSVGGAPYA